MADNEIRNPAKAYFKWKMPVIAKSEDDWNFWNTEDKYNRTMFIGYNDLTTPHVASLFIIVDGKAMQAVGDDVLARIAQMEVDISTQMAEIQQLITQANEQQQSINTLKAEVQLVLQNCSAFANEAEIWAEGSDEDVASYGGEHSAKGWALRASEIISTGLPSEASFDKLSVTGAIPSNDSSTRVPNTEWVQNAIQAGGGGVSPDSNITCKSITATTGGANLVAEYSAERNETASIKVTPATQGTASSITLDVRTSNWEYPAQLRMTNTLMQATVPGRMEITVGDSDISPVDLHIGLRDGITTPWTHQLNCMLPIRANNGLYVKNRSTNEGAFIATNTLDDDAETNPKLSVLGTLSVYGERTHTNGSKSSVTMLAHRAASDTDGSYVMLKAGNSGSGLQSYMDLQEGATQLGTPLLTYFDKGDKSASTEAIRLGKASGQAYSTKRYIYSELIGRFVNGLQIGLINDAERDGIPFKVLRSDDTTTGKWLASFGITPTVPDIADATDSSGKVPNTKWVQAAIAAGGGGGGGGTGGAVSSVNGKTGEVVLAASDVGAATADDITTALEPYAKTTDVNASLADYAKTADVTAEISTATAGLQPKLTAGANITISEDNVISATGGGGTGGAVDSVNGKTGTVVLSGEDINLHPTVGEETYPAISDVIDSISSYLPNGVTSDNKLVDNSSLQTSLALYQPKLTAGEGITISADNVISATGGSGGSAVTSVNGNTGAVVLTADNVMLGTTSTVSINSALAGKQDALNASSSIEVDKVHATGFDIVDSASSTVLFTADKDNLVTNANSILLGTDSTFGMLQGTWFANHISMMDTISGPQVTMTRSFFGQLQGGSNMDETGEFNWYMNTTTDYNKFNVWNRYWETSTDADTGEETHSTVDSLVMSAGGSPDNHSTWIDFTANYLSFKGAANFGETGMSSHTMNFNGVSTFNASAAFQDNVTFYRVDSEGGATQAASFTSLTGAFAINRVITLDGADSTVRLTWDTDSRNTDTYGMHINMPVEITATMPAATDSSNIVPTTAWVQGVAATKANINADNFSVAGKAVLAGMGMPSSKYIDLTLGASGSTYTAPANGWFTLHKAANGAGQYAYMYIVGADIGTCFNVASATDIPSYFLPVKVGDIVKIDYNLGGATNQFRFIYAEGEN